MPRRAPRSTGPLHGDNGLASVAAFEAYIVGLAGISSLFSSVVNLQISKGLFLTGMDPLLMLQAILQRSRL